MTFHILNFIFNEYRRVTAYFDYKIRAVAREFVLLEVLQRARGVRTRSVYLPPLATLSDVVGCPVV